MPFTKHRKHFRVERTDGIATATLTRPGKLNALTFEAHAGLRDLFAEVPQRAEARLMPGTDRTGAPPYE
jgi:enoyl-CoA hydratase/carnithine racemase